MPDEQDSFAKRKVLWHGTAACKSAVRYALGGYPVSVELTGVAFPAGGYDTWTEKWILLCISHGGVFWPLSSAVCAGWRHVWARTWASACEACRIIPGLVSQ